MLDLDSPCRDTSTRSDEAGCEQLVALFVGHHYGYVK